MQTLVPFSSSLHEISPALLGRHQGRRLEDVGRRWPLRHESKLQVVDDPVDDSVLREEGDDLHSAAAPGAEHRVDL